VDSGLDKNFRGFSNEAIYFRAKRTYNKKTLNVEFHININKVYSLQFTGVNKIKFINLLS